MQVFHWGFGALHRKDGHPFPVLRRREGHSFPHQNPAIW
jgi:hypothetical protein